MATLSERIDERIAAIDVAITSIQANAATEIAQMEASKAMLIRARASLTPAMDVLLCELEEIGIL